MRGITYDTAALIAGERGERRMWARHQALLRLREIPTVPTPVVAQAWRGGGRQALLSRLLVGSTIEGFDDQQARAVGVLMARSGSTDVVDACVAEGALRRRDLVVSADEGDLVAIAGAVGRRIEVESA